jgi:hypothetical protein
VEDFAHVEVPIGSGVKDLIRCFFHHRLIVLPFDARE